MLNFRNLVLKLKTHSNYNLNYDFKSINLPENSPTHIVIFTGGFAPHPKLCKDFFASQKLPDYIIAADSGLKTFEKFRKSFKLKIIPNAILGDMDSIKNKKLIKKYEKKISIEKFDPYKDFSDTELALILAAKIKNKSTIVTLVGGSGGRIDHLISIFDIFSSNLRPNFWLTEEQLIVFLACDKTIKIMPSNCSSPISVLRTTRSNKKGFLITSGFEWESDKFRLIGVPSLSNVISAKNFKENKPISITAKNGDFLIATSYSTKIYS